MQARSVKLGVKVLPMYADGPIGTIVEIVNEAYVVVRWRHAPNHTEARSLIKFLRKIT